ncbi:hypothetical protein PENTCL1PPCAC_16184, partial [Pristionchus entomophagus]
MSLFQFDAFPFDVQYCMICFGLEGFSMDSVVLIYQSTERPQMQGNSEWGIAGNISVGELRMPGSGVQLDRRIGYHFALARRSFFWVTLIIVPTVLICVVALAGIFFTHGDKIVENAASIGLTTMTSLMLVVTILADSLAKADNLPGLGWFVLIDIGIVCAAVMAALLLDHCRSAAIGCARRASKQGHYASLLVSKGAYRIARFAFFLLSICALVLNCVLSWS